MKRLIYIFMATVLLTTSCELETSDNGDLDGMWQMHSVDTLATGGKADTRSLGIFWAVQMRLLEMVDTKGVTYKTFFRFEYTGDSLLLSDPYIDNRDSNDIKVTDPAILYHYGVSSLNPRLKVEHLSSDNMTLVSDRLRMYFRKY